MSTNNLIVVSDLHGGSRLGLCKADGPVLLDEGVKYHASPIQQKMYALWLRFWNEWVPRVTKGEPYDVCVNGDAVEGKPHGSIASLSDNPDDQLSIARILLEPIVQNAQTFYVIRGTEAHVGKSGHMEETLAKQLGAKPNEIGQYARYELWIRVGKGLVHLVHHIGTTGRTHYETSAVQAEVAAMFTEAGRWGQKPPDFVVRSHRHRFIKVENPSELGMTIGAVTPGWQAKTPFAYRIPGGRVSTPQFGGLIIRQGDEDVYMRHKVWTVDRPPTEE